MLKPPSFSTIRNQSRPSLYLYNLKKYLLLNKNVLVNKKIKCLFNFLWLVRLRLLRRDKWLVTRPPCSRTVAAGDSFMDSRFRGNDKEMVRFSCFVASTSQSSTSHPTFYKIIRVNPVFPFSVAELLRRMKICV